MEVLESGKNEGVNNSIYASFSENLGDIAEELLCIKKNLHSCRFNDSDT